MNAVLMRREIIEMLWTLEASSWRIYHYQRFKGFIVICKKATSSE